MHGFPETGRVSCIPESRVTGACESPTVGAELGTEIQSSVSTMCDLSTQSSYILSLPSP